MMTTETMEIDQIREALADRNLRAVAERAGISYQTLWRIASEATENPSHESIKKLSEYLLSDSQIRKVSSNE